MWTRKSFSDLYKYNLHSLKSPTGNLFHGLNWASLCSPPFPFSSNFLSFMLSASPNSNRIHGHFQGPHLSFFFLPASVLTSRWQLKRGTLDFLRNLKSWGSKKVIEKKGEKCNSVASPVSEAAQWVSLLRLRSTIRGRSVWAFFEVFPSHVMKSLN